LFIRHATGVFIGFLPESFELGVTGDYTSLFSGDALKSGLMGGISKAAHLFAGGQTFQNRVNTFQMWQGTKPIDMSLTCEVMAFVDPISEVIDPIRELMESAAPINNGDAGSGFFKAPGPNNWMDMSNRNMVMIGQLLRFDSVVFTNVRAKFDSVMHKSGAPLKADVTIDFMTSQVYSRTDINAMFLLGGGSGSSGE
jgi:hypothetical protein